MAALSLSHLIFSVLSTPVFKEVYGNPSLWKFCHLVNCSEAAEQLRFAVCRIV